MNCLFLKRHISDLSKLKLFADDNFEFDENARNFSNRIENVEKKEKLLVWSNFSFSQSVLKDLYCRQVKTCFGKCDIQV